MNHLTIRARLSLLLGIFLIPITLLSYQFGSNLNKNILKSELELKGIIYSKPLLDLMNEVGDYQVTVLVRDFGDAEAQNDLDEGAKTIEERLETLTQNYQNFSKDLSITPESIAEHGQKMLTVEELKEKWKATKNSAYNAENYKEILDNLKTMITIVNVNSGMALDPDLDSYPLVSAVMRDLPNILYELGNVKSNGFELLSKNNNKIPEIKRGEFSEPLAGMKNYTLPAIENAIATSINEDQNYYSKSTSLKENLETALEQYSKASNDVFNILSTLREGGSYDAGKYVEVLDIMHDGTSDFGNAIIPELEKLVEIRLHHLQNNRNITLGISFAVVLASIAGFFFVSNSIGRPVGRIAEILSKIADGETDDSLKIKESHGTDEVSRLGTATEKLRNSVAEAYRLKQMMDDMPSNVLTLDVKDDFKINYANNTSINTLKGLRDLLPVDPSEMVGKSVDIFHKDPSHQRRLLSDPKNLPHRAKIKIGPETMDLNISAIRSKSGEYTGAMLTWQIVTAQEKLAHDFEENVKSIVNIVSSSASELSQTAKSMTSIVKENQEKTGEASNAASQATGTVQSVASATEELSASVKEISTQLEKTNNLIKLSTEKVINADKLAEELKNASARVSDVTELISNISGQINLLALNATIESARAGEAGKGFAVVAGEVKNLASETDKSLAEIDVVTQKMRDASESIVIALTEIRDSINEISTATSNVSAAVEQQSTTTNEISRSMQTTAASTNVISDNLINVNNSSATAATASEQVLVASNELSSQAKQLNTQVDSFLEKVRAG